MIVCEYAEKGELWYYWDLSKRFEEKLARTIFLQIIQGVKECHEAGVVHRDLKLENLLFSSEFNLKIADFGLATWFGGGDDAPTLLTSECGTETYMAPEIKEGNKYDGKKADIYSCGVILLILVLGINPFPNVDQFCFRKNNKEYWEHLQNQYGLNTNNNFISLINNMLDLNPEKRMNVSEILKNDWCIGEVYTQEELKKFLG
mmetsp:Transcript_14733/g.12550  ORF Transcript_14733/g.12550 Transcript_14733/m.12550 type:complete len:203 (+) Transcript_14733:223-831(+)